MDRENNAENNAKCLVFLLRDVLFFKAKQKAPIDNDQAWYEKTPIGKNTLSN